VRDAASPIVIRLRTTGCCTSCAAFNMSGVIDERGATQELAGVEGFEPPYGGIKTRCLTAWRHPNLNNSNQHARDGGAQPAASLSSKGESFSPRAKNAVHAAGTSRKISRPRASVSQAKKTQAPVPVKRAGPNLDSQ